MSYTVAAGLGVLVAIAADLAVLRTKLLGRRVFWATYAIVLAFQLLFNGALTGWGVVRYSPDAILGLRLIAAPVEDLAFGFALVLVTLSGWVYVERRAAVTPSGGSRPGPAR
jgi:lycopene cyclase domain-containing protein